MLHQNDFCICDECNKSNLMYIEKENVMDADPDGHYPVYCEICDEVDCSNPNHN